MNDRDCARLRSVGLALALGLGLAPAAWSQDPPTRPAPPPNSEAASPPTPAPAPRKTTAELQAQAGTPLAADDPQAVAILEAHNQIRADAKLPPLTFAPVLARAAQVQAADMAERVAMSHEGSDGSTPAERIKRAGYKSLATGENVAMFYPNTVAVMRGWLESPPHKANILGDYSEMGIARVDDGNGKPFWCVDFGKPMPQFQATDATSDFVRRLNDARVAEKHAKVVVSPALARAAQAQAAASAKDQGKGGTPTSFSGLDTQKFNELAMSTATGAPTAEAVLTMFLANPDYKNRLLGPSTEVGVGYSTDADGIPYWCLILAKPRR